MRVLFLGNSLHLNKTKSADFFIRILRDFFDDVTVIPAKEAWTYAPKKRWDLLVSFQKRYSPEELEAFRAGNVVLIPMYDDCPHDRPFWSKYTKFKVVCFSSSLERLLSSYGIETLSLRYYPEVPDQSASFQANGGLRGFFWQRVRAIGCSTVRVLIGQTPFSQMRLHWTPDVHDDIGAPVFDPDSFDGQIAVSQWTGERKDYLDLLSESNVFFAPRTLEGIGMSFIEAMAMGLCVVAPNAPTMNEYIENGVTGLLYDAQRPAPLDYSRAKEIGRAARESCIRGRDRWLQALPALKAFLQEPAAGYKPRRHMAIALRGRGISAARRVYRFLKKR